MATARRIPEGHEGVIAHLTMRNAAKAIDYYKAVFGATEVMRLTDSKGRVGHAELKIGKGYVMLAEDMAEPGKAMTQPASNGHTVGMQLYVEDVDAVFKKALAAGAKEVRKPTDEFYGDRVARVEDPFGHQWTLSTHIEDVSMAEMQKRFEQHARR